MPRRDDTFAPFECQGVWWLPEKGQESATAGILRFSMETGLTLELIGTLGGPATMAGGPSRYRMVYGVAKGLHLGTFVTLIDCFRSSFSMASPGLSTETLRASEAYVGEHLSADSDYTFSASEFSTTHLGNWITDSGITTKQSNESGTYVWEFRYEAPEAPQVIVAGTDLSIHLGAETTWSIRSLEIHETVVMRLNFPQSTNPLDINRRLVHPLQNFLSFATDRPNAITLYRFVNERARDFLEGISFLYKPVFSDTSPKETLFEHEMLFSYNDIRGLLAPMLNRWLEISEQLKPAFEAYFSFVYGASTFVEPKFLAMLQAARLYAEARYHLSRKLDAEDSERLLKTMSDAMERAHAVLEAGHHREERFIRAGIEAMIRALKPSVTHLLIPSAHAFVDEMLTIWRETTYQLASSSVRTVSGAGIYWCTQRLSYLFKALILVELGFTAEKIEDLLRRNRQVAHLLSNGTTGAT